MTDAKGSGVSYHPVEHHPPVEEYLQTIESLNEEGTPAIQARIAERLGRSAPTVSEMLDRLATDGYVERSGRTITLTEQGQGVAQTVLRKHRLAERLLVDVIGLPWHLVHDEAGRWEHVMSDEVMARLVLILGDPATCPHGNPIPGSANLRRNSATAARPGRHRARPEGAVRAARAKRSSSTGRRCATWTTPASFRVPTPR